MLIVLAALLSCALDLVLGDPPCLSRAHPVVLMGKAIAAAERGLRRLFPATPRGLLAAGAVLGIGLPLAVFAASAGALALAGLIHPALAFALAVAWGWQALAMRDLRAESMRVHRALTGATLPEARAAVGRIVGRDTAALGEAGVVKAAVETVAENFADGVVSPLLYLLLGGAPAALAYKAINTLDSMVGYRTERYLYFGRVSARLDDVANWLPARLAALFLIAGTYLLGARGQRVAGSLPPACDLPRARLAARAARIWRRDRHNHKSPNSAQTEAAMAGALGVELAGPASYFGVACPKPTIGDCLRPVEPDDIVRANRIMYAGGFAAGAAFVGARVLAVVLFASGMGVDLGGPTGWEVAL